MKQLKYIAFISILLGSMPFMQSCLDNDGNEPNQLVISTINKISADHEFDFTLDDGKKMYPENAEEWKSKQFADGQRAFVLFKKREQSINGYDYTIHIEQLKEILTKEIITIDKEENTEEKVSDDKINTTYMWISKDKKYLTIEFQYYRSLNESKKHFLNLVIPATNEHEKEDSFVHLEFRHNDENNDQGESLLDEPQILTEGYVSFKLNKIKEQLEGKKGLKIRVNTLYKGIQHYEVECE